MVRAALEKEKARAEVPLDEIALIQVDQAEVMVHAPHPEWSERQERPTASSGQ